MTVLAGSLGVQWVMRSIPLDRGDIKPVDIIIPLLLSKEAISVSPSMNFPRTLSTPLKFVR